MPIVIGQKLGLLTVIERGDKHPKLGRLFRCRCECGTEWFVPHSNLLTGNTKSCGCLKRKASGLPFAGASRLREFQTWKHMRDRCENPRDKSYPRYGGRGISVCERWLRFENFLADMGECPPALTLDRIDNNGNYEPGNCRWSDWHQQQNNRSSNSRVMYQGKTRTLAEWARELGMPPTTLINRLQRLGWPVDRAFTEPRQLSYRRRKD